MFWKPTSCLPIIACLGNRCDNSSLPLAEDRHTRHRDGGPSCPPCLTQKGPCTMLQGRARRPGGGRAARGRKSWSVQETDGTGWVLSAWTGGKQLLSHSAEHLCGAFRISYHCPSEFSLAQQCQVERFGAFLRMPRGGFGLSWDTFRVRLPDWKDQKCRHLNLWTQMQQADSEIRKDCISKIRNVGREERGSKLWLAPERIMRFVQKSKGLKQKK